MRFSKLAHRFFSAKEAEYVDGERYLRFFEVWSARESYVKYTGQGIDKYFSEHCTVPEGFVFDEGDSVKKWSAMDSYFATSVIDEKYTWCVCGGKEIDVELRNFNV